MDFSGPVISSVCRDLHARAAERPGRDHALPSGRVPRAGTYKVFLDRPYTVMPMAISGGREIVVRTRR
jgi:hypothetical protein